MFENGDFFLQFGLTSTHIWWKRHPKHTFFSSSKTLSILESVFRSRARTKRKVFENDECHASYRGQCPRGDAIIFPLFYRFVWTGKNDSNTLRVDSYFSKMEKKLLFKNIQKRVDKVSSLCLKGMATILPDLFTWKFREDFIPKPNKYQKQNT